MERMERSKEFRQCRDCMAALERAQYLLKRRDSTEEAIAIPAELRQYIQVSSIQRATRLPPAVLTSIRAAADVKANARETIGYESGCLTQNPLVIERLVREMNLKVIPRGNIGFTNRGRF